MVDQGNRRAFSTFSSLRRFAKEESGKAAKEEAKATQEHCDLCGEPIPPEHRHLLEVSTREIMCACRPCSILFDSKAASEGRYGLIPARRLSLDGFEMRDRKSTRLNSSHANISYAVFCLKKKKKKIDNLKQKKRKTKKVYIMN